MAELLGDPWDTGKRTAVECLQEALNGTKTGELEELNDLDFDF